MAFIMATVVVQQPLGKDRMEAWNSGICDCCEDLNSCCFAYWCFPCFTCATTGNFGESTCLPLLDIFVRYKYHIGGSICEDIMMTCCCIWCSWCQMSREIKARKKVGTCGTVQFSVSFVEFNEKEVERFHHTYSC
uniref:Cornifelin homolog B-like n=1 Tax=Sinocyclocheilus grahami TaxID=75366 RepID=A0A672S2N1_SINGR